jgi:simple sugar transport system permease protein
MRGWLGALVAVGVALVASSLVLALLGFAPGPALRALAAGSVGSPGAIAATLQKSAPLLLTGLAVALAFRCGTWNIGGEGQLAIGALCATAMATRVWPSAPGAVLAPLALASGALGGALVGAIAGALRARRGVSEVISTILLNFIALELVSLAVHGPLQEASGAYPKSDPFPAAALLPRWSRIHLGIPIAIIAAGLVHALLQRSALGFRMRAVGSSPRAARFAGIAPETHGWIALALGGALAGLAGACEVAGVTGQLYEGLSAGTGFTAIAVALLARLQPLAVIPSALFFGALEAGAGAMQREVGVPSVATQVVQAAVIAISAALAVASNSPSLRRRSA